MARDLLLLPGLSCDGELWREQVAALGRRWRCHVADLTACDTLPLLAQSVLGAAAPRFALAAFSFGGYVAQEIMRTSPHRVERLALLATSCRADSPERLAERMSLVGAARPPGRFAGISDRLLSSLVHPARLADAVLIGRIRDMTRRVGRDAFIRQSLVPRTDGAPILEAIRCPTLVLCGRQDRLTTLEHHRTMAALIPGATMHCLEECGHMAPMEKPEAVTRAMEAWLGA